jgi:hypothetical protein
MHALPLLLVAIALGVHGQTCTDAEFYCNQCAASGTCTAPYRPGDGSYDLVCVSSRPLSSCARALSSSIQPQISSSIDGGFNGAYQGADGASPSGSRYVNAPGNEDGSPSTVIVCGAPGSLAGQVGGNVAVTASVATGELDSFILGDQSSLGVSLVAVAAQADTCQT